VCQWSAVAEDAYGLYSRMRLRAWFRAQVLRRDKDIASGSTRPRLEPGGTTAQSGRGTDEAPCPLRRPTTRDDPNDPNNPNNPNNPTLDARFVKSAFSAIPGQRVRGKTRTCAWWAVPARLASQVYSGAGSASANAR